MNSDVCAPMPISAERSEQVGPQASVTSVEARSARTERQTYSVAFGPRSIRSVQRLRQAFFNLLDRRGEPRAASGDGERPLALLVTDLEGFTPLVERLGDRRAQTVIREHNALLRACLRVHRGTEVLHTGDGVLASFKEAHDAVQCALAMQAALKARNAGTRGPQLRIRIGLHRGPALIEEDRLFGAAVVAAVRICNDCPPGRILASRAVYASSQGLRLRFESRGCHVLKGFTEQIELFQVRWGEVASLQDNLESR
jgi:class 3 adenylate cyclase